MKNKLFKIINNYSNIVIQKVKKTFVIYKLFTKKNININYAKMHIIDQ